MRAARRASSTRCCVSPAPSRHVATISAAALAAVTPFPHIALSPVILVTGAAGSAPYPSSLTHGPIPEHSRGVYSSSSSQHLRPLTYHHTRTRIVALSPLSRVHHPLRHGQPLSGAAERHHPFSSSPTLIIPSRNASSALEAAAALVCDSSCGRKLARGWISLAEIETVFGAIPCVHNRMPEAQR